VRGIPEPVVQGAVNVLANDIATCCGFDDPVVSQSIWDIGEHTAFVWDVSATSGYRSI
jgi:hypothetical protein